MIQTPETLTLSPTKLATKVRSTGARQPLTAYSYRIPWFLLFPSPLYTDVQVENWWYRVLGFVGGWVVTCRSFWFII